ncbi:LacI family DNA-binding transcriptional regulator [Aquimarina sp. W85]|uniref:LacI family DNA-binding transcriptional regulator n=1 Tax=Aquimarina rhodophyticola TaxID=3342246 RepID=UPI00366B01EB
MITLKQISRMSGFSVSTVSKALNGRSDISARTTQLIQDIALRNNYIPNKNAIALRKNKSNTLAVLLPQVNDNLYSDTLCEIQKSAAKSGYRVLVYQSFDETSKEDAFLNDIHDGSIDSAIMISTNEVGKRERYSSIPIEFIKVLKEQTQGEYLINLSIKSCKKLMDLI